MILIQPHEIDLHWEECKKLLKPAFRWRVQLHNVDDYYEPLKNGQLQLWRLPGAAMVTSIDKGSNAKVCTILSLSGKNIKSWIADLNETLTKFAKSEGCNAIEAITRKGFSRFVPEFVPDGIVYIKILEN